MKMYKIALIVFSLLFIAGCSKSDLYEYPDSPNDSAEISNFSVLNENGQNVASNVELASESARIFVTVVSGTNVARLVPRASVSEGVIVEPRMGVYTDFSRPKTYTLLAGDRTTKKEWTIVISE